MQGISQSAKISLAQPRRAAPPQTLEACPPRVVIDLTSPLHTPRSAGQPEQAAALAASAGDASVKRILSQAQEHIKQHEGMQKILTDLGVRLEQIKLQTAKQAALPAPVPQNEPRKVSEDNGKGQGDSKAATAYRPRPFRAPRSAAERQRRLITFLRNPDIARAYFKAEHIPAAVHMVGMH